MDKLKQDRTFKQTIEDYFKWIGCWAFHLVFLASPFVFLYMCIKPSLQIFALVYLLWMYYDRETPHKGGRRLLWLRKLRLWQHRRDYFPIELIKTAELPSDTTYLFASFPHGFLSTGAITTFLMEANYFEKIFPGLNSHVCCLGTNLKVPFVRELLLFLGVCTCSAKSILHLLNGPAGNVAVLIVGGMAEMMISHPKTNRIVLKDRKGFVRIALKAGSSLVPVYTFGETDTYDQPLSGKWYKWIQKYRLPGGAALVYFSGPRKLAHLFGLLPYQTPLTVVVGKPIKLPKVDNPSSELVDEYHEIFVREITELFEKYKHKYDSQKGTAVLSIE